MAHHGQESCYAKGCRKAACRQARLDADRRRARRKHQKAWRPVQVVAGIPALVNALSFDGDPVGRAAVVLTGYVARRRGRIG